MNVLRGGLWPLTQGVGLNSRNLLRAGRGWWNLDETTTVQANQFKASGYLDTGKLGQAVSMYGNAAGTAGSTLTFNRGAQISGNNYEHINTNQGTISLWFNPSWDGTGNTVQHDFFYSYGISVFTWSNTSIGVNIAGAGDVFKNMTGVVTHGNWYHLLVSWDADNAFSNGKYAVAYLNGTQMTSYNSLASPYTPYVPSQQSFIGSGNATGNYHSQALIDDFAIFDRVLSTTEIAAIYGNGTSTMVEAGYVADSSLKFYAKMDGSGTLQPVTYNGGASASKMTRASGELAGGTNLLLNGGFETGNPATNWALTGGGTPIVTVVNSGSNLLYDTQSLSVAAGYAYQTVTGLSAGQNLTLSGWIKTENGHIGVYWGTAGTTLLLSGGSSGIDRSSTWQNKQVSLKVPVGYDRISILTQDLGSTLGASYFDNLILTPNLVDNGGMEGTYVGGVAPGWAASSTPTLTDEISTMHSGGHSQKIVAAGNNMGIYQNLTGLTVGNSYLVSSWVYAPSGIFNFIVLEGNSPWGANLVLANSATGSWIKLNGVFKATQTSVTLFARSAIGGAGTFYIDDISVTPLDNVALSLKAWTPVADSGGSSNSLSVQGSSTGVASNATGVRNSAYTFDGSTGYLRQQTIATNIGTLSYVGNDTTTASFTDGAATMSTYAASAPYTHMIVVTNSDNTTSWGYMGTASSGNITIFTTKGGTTRGWNGVAPVAGTKVPVGYEIRKTDFQISGDFSLGAWVKLAAPVNTAYLFAKSSDANISDGFGLSPGRPGNSNYPVFRMNNQILVGTTYVADNNWHYLVGVRSGTTCYIYVDGVATSGTITNPPQDTYYPFGIGNVPVFNAGAYGVNGSIDEPFITAEALTASQILDMYNQRI